tara:strand:- start:68 stop:397 length:330 start_codon:yes stop_codon:yes gene_type:complete
MGEGSHVQFTNSNYETSQDGFWSGIKLTFFYSFCVIAISWLPLFTGNLVLFAIITPIGIPVISIILAIKWKLGGKVAMAKGALTMFLLGTFFGIWITIFTVDYLSNIGR